MRQNELQNEIIAFIGQDLLSDRQDIQIAPQDDLLSDNLLDSMGIMRLISFIDERFKFAVPPEDVTIENFLTVNDMCQYLETRMKVDDLE